MTASGLPGKATGLEKAKRRRASSGVPSIVASRVSARCLDEASLDLRAVGEAPELREGSPHQDPHKSATTGGRSFVEPSAAHCIARNPLAPVDSPSYVDDLGEPKANGSETSVSSHHATTYVVKIPLDFARSI